MQHIALRHATISNMTKQIVPFLVAGVLILFSEFSQSWASATTTTRTHEDDLIVAGDLINSSFGQKPVKETGRSWDFAISGNGFFPLEDSNTGEKLYTRLGRFDLGRDGYIVLSGHSHLRLLAQLESQAKISTLNVLKWVHLKGDMAAGVTFEDDASDIRSIIVIYSGGENIKVGTFVLARFFNNRKLQEVKPHIFKADASALPVLFANPSEKTLGRIKSGALEQL